MDRAFGRRAWAPLDFFELHDVDPPAASIERGCHCLLFGPEGSGKTTLLFQHALAFVKRDPDARVLFVCRRDAVEAAPPLLPQSAADLDAAQRISMKYITTDLDLCKLFSVMHLLPPNELPNLIVIDRLSSFFPDDTGAHGRHENQRSANYGNADHHDWQAARDRREREMRVVRAVAAASECCNSIRTQPPFDAESPAVGGFRGDANDAETSTMINDEEASETSGCLLLASDVSEPNADAPPLGFLLRKWFKCAVRTREMREDERYGSNLNGVHETNPYGSSRSGKPFVLERAWGVGGGGGARGDRTGPIQYAVDSAGASLVDSKFVHE